MRPILPISLSFLLLLSGCGGTMRSVRATPSELRSLPPGEGVVIGSMSIHAGAKDDNTTSLLSGLKGKKWAVIVANAKDLETVTGRMALAALESSEAGQLKVVEGEEKLFVMPLSAGEHLFWSMSASTFSGKMSAPLRVPFRVSPGKKTYIGRLVVEMPAKMNTFLGLPTSARFKVLIEDAQSETINAMREEYGDLLANVEREIMGQAQGAKLPGGSLADAVLQKDVLATVWTLDGVWDNTCTQRKVVDTAVTDSGQRPGIDPWKERWTVDRCGTRVGYVVEFTPSPNGGTVFQVKADVESGK